MIEESTTDQDWIIVEPNKGRILTYLSGRRVVEVNLAKHMKISVDHPEHFFLLEGPTWDEISTKPERLSAHHGMTNPEIDRVRLTDWLNYYNLDIGPPVTSHSIKGPHEKEPWVLRRLVPRMTAAK
jgi:hypothetical protein